MVVEKKKGAPIIEKYESIVDALDIVNNPNDIIELNTDFNKDDKASYQYLKIHNDIAKGKRYESKETLFGTLPCQYDSLDCNRKCKRKGGTRRKPSKRKRRKSKSKK